MEIKAMKDRERLTVLLEPSQIRSLKYFAVDQRVSISKCVRTAVSDFLSKSEADTRESKRGT